MSLKENLNVSCNIQKSTKLFQFQWKRSKKKIDKDGNERVVTIS